MSENSAGLKLPVTPTSHPRIYREWHPTKNGKLKLSDLSRSSLESVWWQCSIDKRHVWTASVRNRVYVSDGCRQCNRERLSDSHPQIAKEWHPTLNGKLTPADVPKSSKLSVYWQCRKNSEHVWKTQVVKRTYVGRTCPRCPKPRNIILGSLAEMRPDVAERWHKKKNGDLTPFHVGFKSSKKVWWHCPIDKSHVFERSVAAVVTSIKNGCPFCAGRRVSRTNSLSNRFPKIAKEWHPTKNEGLNPSEIVYGSNKRVWWQCLKRKHEWVATVNSRTGSGRNCPYCSGHSLSDDNRLSVVRPELVKQWHPTKNGKLTPDDVSFGAQSKVWWQCEVHESHVWQSPPYTRSRGIGCPCCRGIKACAENCLATRQPLVAQLWHPTRNGKLTPKDVTPGSGKAVWWKCMSGHVWKALVSHVVLARVERLTNGCMKCYLLEVKGERILRADEAEDSRINERKRKYGHL